MSEDSEAQSPKKQKRSPIKESPLKQSPVKLPARSAEKSLFDPSQLFKTADVNPKVAKPVKIDVSPKQETQVKPAAVVPPVAQKLSLLPDANYNSENEMMS